MKTTAASSNSRNIAQHPAAVYYMAAVPHGGGGFSQRRGVARQPSGMAGTLSKGEDKEQLEVK